MYIYVRRKDVSEKVGTVGRQNKKRDIYKKSGMSGVSGGKNRRKKNGILKGKGKVSSKTMRNEFEVQ